MTRHILLTILFGIGILYSLYEIIKEWKTKGEKTPYKMKYYSLLLILFAYLIYIQFFD